MRLSGAAALIAVKVERPRVLIQLPYPSDIGFAIGRLVHSFFTAASDFAGSDNVHFCFTDTDTGPSPYLPAGFGHVVAADVYDKDARETSRLADYVRRHQVSVVFALDMPVQAPCLPVLRGAGAKMVVSYWGAPMSSMNHGLRRWLKRMEVAYFRPHRPDLFIFESHAMQELATMGRGIPLADTTVVRTGVDAGRFRPRPEARDLVYSTFGIPGDRQIVVFMGHLHERKGVHILLQAADRVIGSGREDIHFLFLGDRPGEAERFRQHFGPAVQRGFVTFGGYRDNIPDLLAGCSLGCIPSSGWDSYPMSSLELQACGVPVIVSQLQGVPETIAEGRSGRSVPPSDPAALAEALLCLCDDPVLREEMGRMARNRIVQELTVDHQVKRLADVLREAWSRRSQETRRG